MAERSTKTIAEVCSQVVDCPHSTPKWTESGVVVLRSRNIRGGRLDLAAQPSFTTEADYKKRVKRAVPRAGDLVITREAPMGEVCMIPPGLRCCLGQRMVLLRPDDGSMDGRYLLFALQSPSVQHQIRAHDGTGSTVSNLRIPALEALGIPAPPLDEQRRIAAILGALDDKIELNRKMNRTLEEMAQAIFRSWFIDFDGHDDLVDSEIGPVPRGWAVGPIDQIIEVIGGGTPKRSEPRYWGGSVPWFSVQDAPSLSDVFVLDTKEHITEAGLAGSSARLVPAGTTIISARGTVGKLAVVGQPMTFNQSCYGIAPARGYTHAFVYFLLRSVVAHLQRSAHGSVFDTITRATFQTAMVVHPPVERTRAFASIVGPLLKRIAANGRESSTLTDLRDTLLPKLISGELRVPEAEALVEAAS